MLENGLSVDHSKFQDLIAEISLNMNNVHTAGNRDFLIIQHVPSLKRPLL